MGLDDFLAAAKGYPASKCRGVDHWSAPGIVALPRVVIASILDVINDSVAQGWWPSSMAVNLMAILPKLVGGERTVAKTPLLYRIWCRAVQYLVRSWERSVSVPWDHAKEGSSALMSAASRAYSAELAVSLGKHSGAAL